MKDASLDDTIAPSSDATQLASSSPPDVARPTELVLADPARYTITGEIGRGGLGRIMRARDKHLGRHVAIKELLHEGGDLVPRFAREALVTARLMHPAIVPVYDAGTWPTGLPFYAMKMVSGRSLDAVIRDATTMRERLALLPNVIAVADAVAYAHSEGIIHRDLKPANVLVGSFGETVVIDWGLAKDLRGPDLPSLPPRSIESTGGTETIAGSVMGTPSYMPPEQAMGEAVDERADVYAIGALLYHVLSGVPPYVGPTADSVLELVLRTPPTALVVGEIPAELATIVAKAMAREPAGRYRTAAELAEDLRRFQTGGLVSAHLYTVRALLRRWIARNRAVVAVGAVALAVLLAGGGYALHRIYTERDAAVAGERSARERADDAAIAQARAELEADPSASIRALAQVSLESPAWPQVRDLAAEADARGIASRELTLGDGANAVAILPSGDVIVHDRTAIYRWNSRTGALAKLAATPHGTDQILLSPDQRMLAARVRLVEDQRERDNGVQLIDVATGALRPFVPDPNLVTMDFTADSKRLILVGDAFSIVSLADTSHVDLPVATTHLGWNTMLATSRDGKTAVFTTPFDATRCELEKPACKIVPEIESDAPAEMHRMAVAITPSGARVVWAGFRALSLFDPDTRETEQIGDIDHDLGHLAYSPDGKMLVGVTASSAEHGTLYVRDVHQRLAGRWQTDAQLDDLAVADDRAVVGASTGAIVASFASGEKRRLRGQRDAISSVAIRGTQIASASADNTVRLWDVRFAPQPCGLASAANAVVSSDRKLAIAPADDRVAVCDVAADRARFVQTSPPIDHWKSAAISPDGHRAAISMHDALLVVDLATGATTKLDDHFFDALAWGSAGLVAIGVTAGRAWPADLGAPRTLVGFDDELGPTDLAPDGRHYLIAGTAPRVYDTATGKRTPLDGMATFAFSPTGDRLAMTTRTGELRVLTLATAAVQSFVDSPGTIGLVAWSHDGAAIATVNDTTVRLWNLASSTDRIALRIGDKRGVRSMAFSPDDRKLAALTVDGTTHLIDLTTLEARVLGTLDEQAFTVAYWPSGTAIVTTGTSGTATWRDELPVDPAGLHAWLVKATPASDRAAP